MIVFIGLAHASANGMTNPIQRQIQHNKVLDAEPPIASFLKSMLIGGGPVNANVIRMEIWP
jgi:hypothetical protein